MSKNDFKQALDSSIAVEKTSQKIGLLVFVGAVVATVLVYLWRCKFGVDLTDEPFYLAPAWKMFGLGDRPFTDEIFNGMRHSDLLNNLLIKPILPFSVLLLRQAAVVLYAAILLVFTLICFRKKLGLTAGLAFAGCLTFDYFLTPTWSYNWWARDFLLVHHILLLTAWGKHIGGGRRILMIAAGAALGVAIVAYNSLLPALPLSALALLFLEKKLVPLSRSFTESFIPYLLGGGVAVGLDLVFLLSPAVQGDWLISVRSMSSMTEYSRYYALEKIYNVLSFVVNRWEIFALLGLLMAVYADGDWMGIFGKYREPWIRWSKVRAALVLVCLAVLAYQFRNVNQPNEVLGGMVSLGMVGALILMAHAWIDHNPAMFTLVITSLLVAFGIAVSSTNQYLALFWAMPGIIIPFAAQQTDQALLRLRPFSFMAVVREGGAHTGILAALLFFALGSFQFQRTHTYYDVPPGNCDTELHMPPLAGLKTSARRAFLVEEMAHLVGDHEFVLSFAETPGPLFFGRARSAVDTTMVEQGAPIELNQRSLMRMASRKRIPAIAFRSKVRPWYWGIHHPLSNQELKYPANDPYTAFLNCAHGKQLVNYAEFEAYEIKKTKAAECVLNKRGDILIGRNP